MYWRDHCPPHLHAIYQGYEALIAIETGEVIGGRLPPRALRLVREWIELRRGALMEIGNADGNVYHLSESPDRMKKNDRTCENRKSGKAGRISPAPAFFRRH